jgi:2-methylcitrate dehydratase PrpD
MPTAGPSEVITRRAWTSPYFAAMVNAAASHVAEQDDVHNGSVFHPAAVVFPPPYWPWRRRIGASGR